jgi:hypothetical protein
LERNKVVDSVLFYVGAKSGTEQFNHFLAVRHNSCSMRPGGHSFWRAQAAHRYRNRARFDVLACRGLSPAVSGETRAVELPRSVIFGNTWHLVFHDMFGPVYSFLSFYRKKESPEFLILVWGIKQTCKRFSILAIPGISEAC